LESNGGVKRKILCVFSYTIVGMMKGGKGGQNGGTKGAGEQGGTHPANESLQIF
jgi:hypothetical protein